MKRTPWILAALLLASAVTARAYWVYQGKLFNGILSASQNATLDLNSTPNMQTGMTYVSAQAVYSTAALTTSSFTDGSASTNSITVVTNVGLSSASAVDQVTVAATSKILGSPATAQMTIVANSTVPIVTITINGTALVEQTNWFQGLTSSNTATSLAAAVNGIGGIHAQAIGSVVYATATLVGLGGNAFTLATSSSPIVSVSSSNFSGGLPPPLINAYLTVNGTVLKQGYQWYAQKTSSGTATSIAKALGYIPGVVANAVGSVVFATATVAGAGNAYSLTSSSPSFLTVATPLFTGGADNASVTIGGIQLFQGSQWSKGATTTATAASIAHAIDTDAYLSTVLISTNVGNVVKSTSTAVGSAFNFAVVSSTPSALTPSGPFFAGGTNPGYTFNTGLINIASSGYGVGSPLLYTSAATLHPLTTGTTYYATAITATSFGLATSAANALAGTFVTFTSSSTQTTAHTFTLTPLTYSGTVVLGWYGSNDGVNYNALPGITPANIVSPTSSPASLLWDFGQINYRYLQLQATGPTQGGLNLTVTIKGGN